MVEATAAIPTIAENASKTNCIIDGKLLILATCNPKAIKPRTVKISINGTYTTVNGYFVFLGITNF